MNLSYKEKLTQRKTILDFLKNIPEGKKVRIDKELLEELLFVKTYAVAYINENASEVLENIMNISEEKLNETDDIDEIDEIYDEFEQLYDELINQTGVNLVPINETKKATEMIEGQNIKEIKKEYPLAKFPIWTGEFLRKIDLSEVDFSNVVWNQETLSNYKVIFICEEKDCEEYSLARQNSKIDLSNTNANIDFSKSFDAHVFRDINCIGDCNLANVDLSNSNTQDITALFNTNVNNTSYICNPYNFLAIQSDLRNNDLSDVTISIAPQIQENHNSKLLDCLVEETELSIEVDTTNENIPKENFDKFFKDVEDGKYNGCRIKILGIDYTKRRP